MKTQGPLPLVPTICLLALLLRPLLAQADPTNTPQNLLPVLSLQEAAALALEGNPKLQVFDLEIRAREALIIQAGVKPNPDLSLDVENFAGSGPFGGLDGSEVTLSVGQLMERGGKRARRTELAHLNQGLAEWDYQATRLEVLAGVARTFVKVAFAQERLTVASSLIDVAQQDLSGVKLRVAAGSASPIELTRAEVALATAALEKTSRNLQLQAARNALVATWGGGEPTVFQVRTDFGKTPPPPAFATLSPRLNNNPNLARWQTELARGKATVALERALGTVDFTAMLGLRRLNEADNNAFVLGLSMPLPLNNKNQGNIRAATYRMDQIQQSRRVQAIEMEAEAKSAYARLTTAYNEVTALQDQILPLADQAMATAYDAYQQGLFNFTDVLAVRLNYFQLQERLLESLARFHTATADLELLIAGPITLDAAEQE